MLKETIYGFRCEQCGECTKHVEVTHGFKCTVCGHVKEKRAYRERPDVKAKQRAYQRAYSQRADVKAKQRAYSQRHIK